MSEDIIQVAKKQDVEVFVEESHRKSLISNEKVIYGTPGVFQHLSDKSSVEARDYHSIFLGTTQIVELPFEKKDLSKVSDYYLIGSEAQMVKFKQELVNVYGGNFPHPVKMSKETEFMVIGVWSIVYVLLVMLTLYEILMLKKETMVRVILGADLRKIASKHLGYDLLFYIITFTILMGNMSFFPDTTFKLSLSLAAFLIFLVVNSCAYLFLLKVDYKRDLTTMSGAKGLLTVNYLFKGATIILTTLMMSTYFGVIANGIDYYQQKDFFEENKDKSYTMLAGEQTENIDLDGKNNDELRKKDYKSALDKEAVLAIVNVRTLNDNKALLLADKGAISYLSQQIPELAIDQLEEKVYFLIPEKLAADEAAVTAMKES